MTKLIFKTGTELYLWIDQQTGSLRIHRNLEHMEPDFEDYIPIGEREIRGFIEGLQIMEDEMNQSKFTVQLVQQ